MSCQLSFSSMYINIVMCIDGVHTLKIWCGKQLLDRKLICGSRVCAPETHLHKGLCTFARGWCGHSSAL